MNKHFDKTQCREKGISTSIIIIIIVAVAVVAVGGVLAYQYFSTKTQSVVQTQQNQNNQTTGWKTYTSTQYGFEFQYPTNITVVDNTSTGDGSSLQVGQSFRININPKPSSYTTLLDDVKSTVYEVNLPLSQGAMPSNTTYTQKSTGNLDGYLIQTKAADAPINTSDRFVIDNKNYLFAFFYNYQGWILQKNPQDVLAGGPVTPDFQKDLDARLAEYNQIQTIISTFKFTTPTGQTAGIKTGKITIDYQQVKTLQASVDQGSQPWRLNPESVVRAEIGQYDFTQSDLSSLKLTLHAASAAVNEYEITHNGKTYTITVIQAVPGSGQIWVISSIELK